jgi:hypothetical protein
MPVFDLVSGSEYVYQPPFANVVRWRVWPVGADAVPGAASEWRYFEYD